MLRISHLNKKIIIIKKIKEMFSINQHIKYFTWTELVNTFLAISLAVCVGNYTIKSNSHLLSITIGLTLDTTNGTTKLISTNCVQGIFLNFKCDFQTFT